MDTQQSTFSNITKTLGPGLLFAGAAIGGSHLIQCTRAGANYGFELIWLVLLINLLKYPFFQFAQRYVTVTNHNMLHGYSKLGSWVLILYLGLSLFTGFLTLSAVSYINANIAAYLLGATISPLIISIGLMTLCASILLFGRYTWLDRTVKVILVVLTLSTLIAVIFGLPNGWTRATTTPAPDLWHFAGISFMLALMGWMPAPIEVSVWPTLWAKQRYKQTNYHPTLKEALLDFNIGYIGSTFLAVMFISLGALVMFGSGEYFSRSGIIFAEQWISMYTTHIGQWSHPIIAIIAFTTLFSTTLTCLDAYPRVIATGLSIVFPETKRFRTVIYWYAVLLFFFGSIIISGYFVRKVRMLIDTATILAFCTGPIFAYFNYRVVTHPSIMPKEHRPSNTLLWLSRIGLAFMLTVSLSYIAWMILG